jgi:hypothetical protein
MARFLPYADGLVIALLRAARYTGWNRRVRPEGHLASFRVASYPRELRTAGLPADICP